VARPRTTQAGKFERTRRRTACRWRQARSAKWVFEHCQQRDRREFLGDRLRHQPQEHRRR
jgi:hypothetical protein